MRPEATGRRVKSAGNNKVAEIEGARADAKQPFAACIGGGLEQTNVLDCTTQRFQRLEFVGGQAQVERSEILFEAVTLARSWYRHHVYSTF